MANTTSTSSVLDQTSDAAFRNWVAEIIATLTVTLTLSQTNDTGQINTATVTRASANTAAGYSIFRFTDPLNLGPIATTNALVGGSAYTNGTYTAVPLTGGTGTGALATVVVSGGAVSSVTITTAGTGYNVCDQLSALAATIGGTGSGFHVNVATLTSGSPVVFKLEYGSAAANNIPEMWITVAQGSNGSGTLTGTVLQRCAASVGNPAASLITSYTSRFCVNMTVGNVGLAWKIGAPGTSTIGQGGFQLFRSNDSSGNPSGDSINLFTNSITASASASQGGQYVGYSYLTGAQMPTAVLSAAASGAWVGANNSTNAMPFGITTTAFGGNSYTTPVYYLTPIPSISAYNTVALNTEVGVGSTISEAIVGATTRTLLNVGTPWGTGNLGVLSTSTSGFCMLWE